MKNQMCMNDEMLIDQHCFYPTNICIWMASCLWYCCNPIREILSQLFIIICAIIDLLGLHPVYHPAPILHECHYYYGVIEDSFCASAGM